MLLGQYEQKDQSITTSRPL